MKDLFADQRPKPPTNRYAANADPVTSHEAAQKLLDSCKLGADQQLALYTVGRFPGRTAIDLGRLLAVDDENHRGAEYWRQLVGRRLPELQDLGLVRAEGHATDPVTGCRARRWYPTQLPAKGDPR